jgi:hypothetical protein
MILMAEPEMAQPKNWRPLDGRETNFNVTSNQASDGGKALTELMTNMVDAVLLKRAYEEGVNPKGKDAPLTMYDAVKTLVNKRLVGGKLTSLSADDGWLRKFALENLVIGVTGAKNKKAGLPCYTFVDNGEGQTAQNFPTTFLSLSQGNKKEISFVQGKYNMGSSGVLQYCGFLGYKLIVSRRYDKKYPWAWTLLRKRPNEGMPIFHYFVQPDGSVPSFDRASVEPFHLGDGSVFHELAWEAGTIVKLYDYQIGNEFLSFRGSREALNENLIETILPFRILDFRQKPAPRKSGFRKFGIDERSFHGMEWLLLRTHTNELDTAEVDEEDGPEEEASAGEAAAQGEISVGIIDHPRLGQIRISAVVLKKGKLPQWLKPPKHINRVFHGVHGQVQFKQTRGYLTDCNFPALKDRIVVFVDASNLTFEAHNGVWKADREHINNTFWGQLYKEQVTKAIRESQTLKALQQTIAQEELDSSTNEQSIELFEKLLKEDKNFAALLKGTPPKIAISASGTNAGETPSGEEYEGKYSPTFLKFEEKVHGKKICIPINLTRPIAASTDAANDYFDRPDNPGRLVISEPAASKFSVRTHLRNGRITIFLQPIAGELSVAEEIQIHARLIDSTNAHYDASDKCTVLITEQEEKPPPNKRNPGPNPRPPIDQSGSKRGQSSTIPSLAIPQFQFLTSDGRNIGDEETVQWPEGFTEKDGGYVEDFGEAGVKFFINYDNAFHKAAKQRQRGDIAKAAISEKYKWGMLVLMLSYEQAYRSLAAEQSAPLTEFMDQFRSLAAKGAASTVLTIAEVLPKILDTSNLDTE